MKYAVYKLSFKAGVHLGSGALSSNGISFLADSLFSALYIEALKLNKAAEFYRTVDEGRLLFSDAFPYVENKYYLPKPMLYIEPKDKGSSALKKAYKKLKYIPAELMNAYIEGNVDIAECTMKGLGAEAEQVMTAVDRAGGDAEPFNVGVYYFNKGCGLYVISAYEEDEDKELFEEIMESLSYTGIGGKKSAGKGSFEFLYAKGTDSLLELLRQKTGRCMLLSTALPKDDELEEAISGASYLLQKRSGFVYSAEFTDTMVKKDDLYTMQAGSCFDRPFKGGIYDVSGGRGTHAVYRYAKSLFMEV